MSNRVLALRQRASLDFRAGQPTSLGTHEATSASDVAVDPWRANAVLVESEPMRRVGELGAVDPDADEALCQGSLVTTECLTVLLASMRCPLTCVMCDLWKRTLSHPTPVGAITHQVREAMSAYPSARGTLKLYNAGNFFDPRATPDRDLMALAELGGQFDRVVVENHPRFGWSRLIRFAERLDSRLEVAVGLESVAPRMLSRLNKRLTRDRFAEHARELRDRHVGLRVFLIVGLPWHSPRESVRWAKLSSLFAARVGATHITFLACRSGNGFLDELEVEGVFRPPTLRMMSDVLVWALHDQRVSKQSVVTVDTWGIEGLESCATCARDGVQYLEAMNQTQRVPVSVPLPVPCDCDETHTVSHGFRDGASGVDDRAD
ncbi:MAG: radical SAM protein [Planctomycetota bacterium]